MRSILDLTPMPGEMLKPKELIDLRHTGALTLQDRRVFNALVDNAWGPSLREPGHQFEIRSADLRPETPHTDRLRDSIAKLMGTICVVLVEEDGREFELRTPLLSTNKLETTANDGVFRYQFTPELAALLGDSAIFAKLDKETMRSFRSKYGFALYEAIARRVRMKSFMEELALDDMRHLLGVEDGKLMAYKSLNQYAIQPALSEVNAISDFDVSIVPKKTGRKVTSFLLGWNAKTADAKREAYAERQRHSTGREARASGATETVVANPAIEPAKED